MDMFEIEGLIIQILGLQQDTFEDNLHLSNEQLKELLLQQKEKIENFGDFQLNLQKNFIEHKFIEKIISSKVGFSSSMSLLSYILQRDTPFTYVIESKEIINSVIDRGCSNEDDLEDVIHFLGSMISIYQKFDDENKQLPSIILLIISRTKDFISLIKESKDKIQTTIGEISPIGWTSLNVFSHLSNLSKILYKPVQQEFLDLKIMELSMELFFKYPLNNILHNHVYTIISSILVASGCIELKKKLIYDMKLPNVILSAVKNTKYSLIHLYEITNLIVTIGSDEHFSFIESYCEKIDGWKEFIIGTISKYNENATKEIGGPVPFGLGFSSNFPINIKEQIVEDPKEEISPEEDELKDEDPKNVLNVQTHVVEDDFDANFDSAFI